jgi:hypothetical protein
MAPPATLEEPQPLTAEDEGVYQAIIRCAPPGAIQRCDPELVIKCIRGYKKEKPRVEQTIAELLRIQDWREKDEIDLVRAQGRERAMRALRGCKAASRVALQLRGATAWGQPLLRLCCARAAPRPRAWQPRPPAARTRLSATSRHGALGPQTAQTLMPSRLRSPAAAHQAPAQGG